MAKGRVISIRWASARKPFLRIHKRKQVKRMDADRPSMLKENVVQDEIPPGARPILFSCFRELLILRTLC